MPIAHLYESDEELFDILFHALLIAIFEQRHDYPKDHPLREMMDTYWAFRGKYPDGNKLPESLDFVVSLLRVIEKLRPDLEKEEQAGKIEGREHLLWWPGKTLAAMDQINFLLYRKGLLRLYPSPEQDTLTKLPDDGRH